MDKPRLMDRLREAIRMESLPLRVKDVDFAYRQIIIREGQGQQRSCHAVNRYARRAAADTA